MAPVRLGGVLGIAALALLVTLSFIRPAQAAAFEGPGRLGCFNK
jgi:hypothetical protein